MVKKDKLLVSAIITTYQRHPQIVQRALESILQQTYPNIEMIVVDDSPFDYPYRSEVKATVIAICMGSVKYIMNQENIGACASRNVGIQASRGEYIALLDDDDEWLPDKIEKQVNAFTKKEIGLVTCDAFYCYDNGRKELRSNIVNQEIDVLDQLLISNFVGGCSFPLIRRECFDKCGFFKPDLPSSQDLEMYLRIATLYQLYFIHEPLLVYHVHSGERISKNISKKAESFAIIDDIYNDYLMEHQSVYRERTRCEIRYCLIHREFHFAQTFYQRLARSSPNHRLGNIILWLNVFPKYTVIGFLSAARRISRDFLSHIKSNREIKA